MRLLDTYLKPIALGVAVVYFTANCALSHATESNFWEARRRATEQKQGEPMQLASVPATSAADPSRILQNLSSSAPNISSAIISQKDRLSGAAGPRPLLDALPFAYGNIRSVVSPSSANASKKPPLVIHIQDVHLNPEAQANIGHTLQALIDKKITTLVALEGAFGPMDIARLRSVSHKDDMHAVDDFLLERKMISGALHAGLISATEPPAFIGVDDFNHYHANVEAYRVSAPRQKAYRERLAVWGTALARRKAETYNQELLRFDARVQGYSAKTVSFGDYARALARPGANISRDTRNLLDALEREGRLDFAQVERERAVLIQKLVRVLSQNDVAALVRQSVAYRSGQIKYGEFYAYLRDLCGRSGISLDEYPAMREYVSYVLLADGIQPSRLYGELERLEKKDYAVLVKSPAEKSLTEESRVFALTSKLVDFSLTPEEWKEYKAAEKHGVPELDLSSFEDFYRHAEARDRAMAENLLKALPRDSAAVLVTGGFHSSGVERLLTEAGCVVVDFAPKITKVAEDGSSYLSVFTQEKTPLEKLFEGPKLFVSPEQLPPSIEMRRDLLYLAQSAPGDDRAAMDRAAETIGRSGMAVVGAEVQQVLGGLDAQVTLADGRKPGLVAIMSGARIVGYREHTLAFSLVPRNRLFWWFTVLTERAHYVAGKLAGLTVEFRNLAYRDQGLPHVLVTGGKETPKRLAGFFAAGLIPAFGVIFGVMISTGVLSFVVVSALLSGSGWTWSVGHILWVAAVVIFVALLYPAGMDLRYNGPFSSDERSDWRQMKAAWRGQAIPREGENYAAYSLPPRDTDAWRFVMHFGNEEQAAKVLEFVAGTRDVLQITEYRQITRETADDRITGRFVVKLGDGPAIVFFLKWSEIGSEILIENRIIQKIRDYDPTLAPPAHSAYTGVDPVLVTRPVDVLSSLPSHDVDNGWDFVRELGVALGKLHAIGYSHGRLYAGDELDLRHIYIQEIDGKRRVGFTDYRWAREISRARPEAEVEGVIESLGTAYPGVSDIEARFREGYQAGQTYIAEHPPQADVPEALPAEAAPLEASDITPDMPAYYLFGEFMELLNEGEELPSPGSVDGVAIRRVAAPQGPLPERFQFLLRELANTSTFDLLFNKAGHLIAVFPVITDAFAQAPLNLQGWEEGSPRPTPKYFNFSPYYFEIPRIGDPEARYKWERLAMNVEDDRYQIERYRQLSINKGGDIEPAGSGDAPYAYVTIGADGSSFSSAGLYPLDPDSLRHIPTALPAGKHGIIIPVFPTVYSPSNKDHVSFDRNYYLAVLGNVDAGQDVLVVGPGSGIDAWLAALKNPETISAVGISPLEIANLRATARLGGFSDKLADVIVQDNVADADGTTHFQGRRFHRIFWNMEKTGWDSSRPRPYPLSYGWRWEDPQQTVVRRFARPLPNLLHPREGLAVLSVRPLGAKENIWAVLASAGKVGIEDGRTIHHLRPDEQELTVTNERSLFFVRTAIPTGGEKTVDVDLDLPDPLLDSEGSAGNRRIRFIRDIARNVFQIILNPGLVQMALANALNESVSFRVLDSQSSRPVNVGFIYRRPKVWEDGRRRYVSYGVSIDAKEVTLGGFVLGSMRTEREIERNVQSADLEDVAAEYQRNMETLQRTIDAIEGMADDGLRQKALRYLNAVSVEELRSRLKPKISISEDGKEVTVMQAYFDGKNELSLMFHFPHDVDVQEENGRIRVTFGKISNMWITVGTGASPLMPLDRSEIFKEEFLAEFDALKRKVGPLKHLRVVSPLKKEYDRIKGRPADTWTPAEWEFIETCDKFLWLDRFITEAELLISVEKIMAGLKNYATYFGRDTLMTLMLLKDVLKVEAQETVLSTVLRKLNAEGRVSHEETLGLMALIENLRDNFLPRMEQADGLDGSGNAADARALREQAVAQLADLQSTRDEYRMRDDDPMLSVALQLMTEQYMHGEDVSRERKAAFLRENAPFLARNFKYVIALAHPFVENREVENLIPFPAGEIESMAGIPIKYLTSSWRDSVVGYGNGKYSLDVNALWMPLALRAIYNLVDEMRQSGIDPFAEPDLAGLEGAVAELPQWANIWEGSRAFFNTRLTEDAVRDGIRTKLAFLEENGRAAMADHWRRRVVWIDHSPDGRPGRQVTLDGFLQGESLPFLKEGLPMLSLVLDESGRPIPIMNTDVGMFLLFNGKALMAGVLEGKVSLGEVIQKILAPLFLMHPIGLFVPEAGAVVANDAYAGRQVMEMFWEDLYHSPYVSWSRENAIAIKALAEFLMEAFNADGTLKGSAHIAPKDFQAFVDAAYGLMEILRDAIANSHLIDKELWTYEISEGADTPGGSAVRSVPYRSDTESSTDVQAWALAEISVRRALDWIRQTAHPRLGDHRRTMEDYYRLLSTLMELAKAEPEQTGVTHSGGHPFSKAGYWMMGWLGLTIAMTVFLGVFNGPLNWIAFALIAIFGYLPAAGFGGVFAFYRNSHVAHHLSARDLGEARQQAEELGFPRVIHMWGSFIAVHNGFGRQKNPFRQWADMMVLTHEVTPTWEFRWHWMREVPGLIATVLFPIVIFVSVSWSVARGRVANDAQQRFIQAFGGEATAKDVLRVVAGTDDFSQITDFPPAREVRRRDAVTNEHTVVLKTGTFKFFVKTMQRGNPDGWLIQEAEIIAKAERYDPTLVPPSLLIHINDRPVLITRAVAVLESFPPEKDGDWDFFRELGIALGKIHALGIYHGDIGILDREFPFEHVFIQRDANGLHLGLMDFGQSEIDESGSMLRSEFATVMHALIVHYPQAKKVAGRFADGYYEGNAAAARSLTPAVGFWKRLAVFQHEAGHLILGFFPGLLLVAFRNYKEWKSEGAAVEGRLDLLRIFSRKSSAENLSRLADSRFGRFRLIAYYLGGFLPMVPGLAFWGMHSWLIPFLLAQGHSSIMPLLIPFLVYALWALFFFIPYLIDFWFNYGSSSTHSERGESDLAKAWKVFWGKREGIFQDGRPVARTLTLGDGVLSDDDVVGQLWPPAVPRNAAGRGIPAYYFLEQLFHGAQVLRIEDVTSTLDREMFENATVRRVWVGRSPEGELPGGLERLREELEEAGILPEALDFIYDVQGRLAAIFPHFTEGGAEPTKYFDLAYLYYAPSTLEDFQAMGRDLETHRASLERWKTFFGGPRNNLSPVTAPRFVHAVLDLDVEPSERSRLLVEIDADGPMTDDIGLFDVVPELFDHPVTQLIIPIFPTVYSPADAPNKASDVEFYMHLIGNDGDRFDFDGLNGDSDLLVGFTGSGLDSVISALLSHYSHANLYATDINPFAIATVQYLFHGLGPAYEKRLTALVRDNIADENGVPLIRKADGTPVEFDRVVLPMPSHAPTYRSISSQVTRQWDKVPTSILLRVAMVLPIILKRKGKALAWNQPYVDDLLRDEVAEAFRTAGAYLRLGNGSRSDEWAEGLPHPMHVDEYRPSAEDIDSVYVITHAADSAGDSGHAFARAGYWAVGWAGLAVAMTALWGLQAGPLNWIVFALIVIFAYLPAVGFGGVLVSYGNGHVAHHLTARNMGEARRQAEQLGFQRVIHMWGRYIAVREEFGRRKNILRLWADMMVLAHEVTPTWEFRWHWMREVPGLIAMVLFPIVIGVGIKWRFVRQRPENQPVPESIPTSAASLWPYGVTREMPAYYFVEGLFQGAQVGSVEDVTQQVLAGPVADARTAFEGATVKRVRWKDIDPQSMSGLQVLAWEFGDGHFLPDALDLVYNSEGQLIAILPHVDKGHFQKRLFDLTHLYFTLPSRQGMRRMGSHGQESLAKDWERYCRDFILSEDPQANLNSALIDQVLKANFLKGVERLAGIRLGSSPSYTHAGLHVPRGNPRERKLSLTTVLMTSGSGAVLQAAQSSAHSSDDTLLFANMPTVYPPAYGPHQGADKESYDYLIGKYRERFNLNGLDRDSKILVMGTGSGLDAALIALLTQDSRATIYVTDINPFAIASLRALFHQLGPEYEKRLKTFVMDNVGDEDGNPLILENGRPVEFDCIFGNLPRHDPRVTKRSLRMMENWDGVPGTFLYRVSRVLLKILKPRGVALMWNKPYIDESGRDEVAEAFRTAGRYLKADAASRDEIVLQGGPRMDVHVTDPHGMESVYLVKHQASDDRPGHAFSRAGYWTAGWTGLTIAMAVSAVLLGIFIGPLNSALLWTAFALILFFGYLPTAGFGGVYAYYGNSHVAHHLTAQNMGEAQRQAEELVFPRVIHMWGRYIAVREDFGRQKNGFRKWADMMVLTHELAKREIPGLIFMVLFPVVGFVWISWSIARRRVANDARERFIQAFGGETTAKEVLRLVADTEDLSQITEFTLPREVSRREAVTNEYAVVLKTGTFKFFVKTMKERDLDHKLVLETEIITKARSYDPSLAPPTLLIHMNDRPVLISRAVAVVDKLPPEKDGDWDFIQELGITFGKLHALGIFYADLSPLQINEFRFRHIFIHVDAAGHQRVGLIDFGQSKMDSNILGLTMDLEFIRVRDALIALYPGAEDISHRFLEGYREGKMSVAGQLLGRAQTVDVAEQLNGMLSEMSASLGLETWRQSQGPGPDSRFIASLEKYLQLEKEDSRHFEESYHREFAARLGHAADAADVGAGLTALADRTGQWVPAQLLHLLGPEDSSGVQGPPWRNVVVPRELDMKRLREVIEESSRVDERGGSPTISLWLEDMNSKEDVRELAVQMGIQVTIMDASQVIIREAGVLVISLAAAAAQVGAHLPEYGAVQWLAPSGTLLDRSRLADSSPFYGATLIWLKWLEATLKAMPLQPIQYETLLEAIRRLAASA